MTDIIEAKNLSLNQFIDALFSSDSNKLSPCNHFPTDEMLNEFISSIRDRTDKDIKNILRKFLIHNETFGSDIFRIDSILSEIRNSKKISKFDEFEYHRRLMNKVAKKHAEVWEGLTWTLDLLPHFPSEAIKAIDAYFLANCQMLPDSCLTALGDCTAIIRARYIDYTHPKEVLITLPPKDFEFLIAALYEELGYEVKLTKASHDGGIDIHATRKEVTRKEYLLIQCKRYTKTIGVKDIRELLGVVSNEKATKGTLVASSKFSIDAIKFSDSNSSIELIGFDELVKLLNFHFSIYWPSKIDRLINEQKKKHVFK